MQRIVKAAQNDKTLCVLWVKNHVSIRITTALSISYFLYIEVDFTTRKLSCSYLFKNEQNKSYSYLNNQFIISNKNSALVLYRKLHKVALRLQFHA